MPRNVQKAQIVMMQLPHQLIEYQIQTIVIAAHDIISLQLRSDQIIARKNGNVVAELLNSKAGKLPYWSWFCRLPLGQRISPGHLQLLTVRGARFTVRSQIIESLLTAPTHHGKQQ